MTNNHKPKKKRQPINVKRVVLVMVFTIYMSISLYNAIKNSKKVDGTLEYIELMDLIDDGKVSSIDIVKNQDTAYVNTVDGKSYVIINPKSDTFIEDLMKKGVHISVRKVSRFDSILNVMLSLPLVVIMALIAVYISGTIVGGSTKMFTLLKHKDNRVTFDDIQGMSETKEDVKFLVHQIKNWRHLDQLGARPCKGALLYGPPGTGKTMLAKAIAEEAGVSFISASGSDFNEVFVGVGASRVRALWDLARANVPCIVFIDEIDCLGKRRRDATNQENNQTLNCLLQKMDGLNDTSGIMVIGATNMRDTLDSALLRPGRLDKQYYIGPPSCKKDRDEIVEIYLRNKKLGEDVDLNKASKLMVGLTGAEIEQSLNEAVYISIQENRDGVIKLSDIDEAVMKLRMSGVKKEHTSDRDRDIVSVHESGHAIVTLLLGLDVSKVSIVPYSNGTGGVTLRDMDKTEDVKLKMKSEFENEIKILLAGKVAEEVVFGEHTQGCSNDIEKATELMYNMVTRFGLGSRLINENVLIENGISHLIESDIIADCDNRLNQLNVSVRELLESNKKRLNNLSEKLKEEKTIVEPTLDYIDSL